MRYLELIGIAGQEVPITAETQDSRETCVKIIVVRHK